MPRCEHGLADGSNLQLHVHLLIRAHLVDLYGAWHLCAKACVTNFVSVHQ